MKSRLTIITLLVAGILLIGAGAALAVSGVSGSGSSGSAQYSTDTTDTQTVLPTSETNAPPTQDTGQVSSGGNEVPFTGYAAIPVLLAGAALLGTGLVMRRRTAHRRL